KERGESETGFAPTVFRPVEDRINATADLAHAWVRLRRTPRSGRRVAVILANYPSRDGRLANGVGLDTPQSLVDALAALREAGYGIDRAPDDAAAMMQLLQASPTNGLEERDARPGGGSWPVTDYEPAFASVPENVRRVVEARWGIPADDPHVSNGNFRLGLHR